MSNPIDRITDSLELFTSHDNRPFTLIPCAGNTRGWQAVPLRSTIFRNWFFAEVLSLVDSVPTAHAFRGILDQLEARAVHDPARRRITVPRRVGLLYEGPLPASLLLDLATPEGQLVEVTAKGWNVKTVSPMPFELSPSALPSPIPVAASDASPAPLETLRSCLNLPDRAAWLRCLAWLLAAFRSDGPHPVLILQGPPQSGKSFAARVLRQFVDPVTAALAPTPTSVREVAALAGRNWVVALDHVSALSPNVTDALCRLSSGLGVTYHEQLRGPGAAPLECTYKRPVILTVTDRWTCPEDLASRALIVDFQPIPAERRRTEADLTNVVNDAFPLILGSLLTLLSAALKGAAELARPAAGNHCADALAWAIGAAPAIGCTREELQAVFTPPPPVVGGIQSLLDTAGSWTGTATELTAALGMDRAPQAFSRDLKRFVHALADLNIDARFHRAAKGRRLIELTLARQSPGPPVAPQAGSLQPGVTRPVPEGDDIPENPPPISSPAPDPLPQVIHPPQLIPLLIRDRDGSGASSPGPGEPRCRV